MVNKDYHYCLSVNSRHVGLSGLCHSINPYEWCGLFLQVTHQVWQQENNDLFLSRMCNKKTQTVSYTFDESRSSLVLLGRLVSLPALQRHNRQLVCWCWTNLLTGRSSRYHYTKVPHYHDHHILPLLCRRHRSCCLQDVGVGLNETFHKTYSRCLHRSKLSFATADNLVSVKNVQQENTNS